MRRAMTAGAVVIIALVAVNRGNSTSTVRVDALFANAAGMVPGQNVEVAGTKVGTVSALKLIRGADGGYTARMTLTVDRRYSPFRADASCRILPQGIISENYVDCQPGTSPTLLPADASGVPTVGIGHTTTPLSLQSVLNTFAAPAPERLQILIDELGLATAGRGTDIQAVLERADPALTETSRVLQLINAQRDELSRAVGQTDQVLRALATDRAGVRGFVDHASTTLRTTAAHNANLSASVHRLPAFLTAVERALAPVIRATAAATPLLADLRVAAPGVTALTRNLPPFVHNATPAVAAVGAAAHVGRSALASAAPVIAHLTPLAKSARPLARTLSSLLTSLRNSGGLDDALNLFYALGMGVGAYDKSSHLVSTIPVIFPACVLNTATPHAKLLPGCSHAYNAPGLGEIPPSQVPESNGGSGQPSAAHLGNLLHYLLGR